MYRYHTSVLPFFCAGVLRDFSAPVVLTVTGQTEEHLLFQFAHDSDPFNRCRGIMLVKLQGPMGMFSQPERDTGQ